MVSEKNRLKVLDKGDVDKIHSATLEVLAKVGIRLESEDALRLMEKNGFEVDQKAKIVRMGESAVSEAIKSCAHNFRWHARNPKNSFDIVDGRTKFGPGSQCLAMIDPDTGQTRPSTLDDAIMIVKLLDSIDLCAYGGVPVYFNDVPPDYSSVVSWFVGLANSSKASYGGWADEKEWELMMRVADALLGDREQLRKKVVFCGYVDPVSPLTQDKAMLDIITRYSEWNMPVFVMAMALAGGTAPASLAGLLVQQNAEILSAAVLSKCACKHPKIVYGSVSCPLDMRSGISATGSPEFSLLGAGAVQLAKHYRLPSDMGVQSDSKAVDAQLSYEKVQSALMAVLAGTDSAELSLGSTESFYAFSMVQLMIDEEIFSSAERIAKGIEVSEETLSVDLIGKTGPMGNYLKDPRTLRQFKKEHYISTLSDRSTRQQWMAAGSKDANQRARERANKMLTSHSPDPLEPEIAKGFEEILRDYSKGYDLKSLMECSRRI